MTSIDMVSISSYVKFKQCVKPLLDLHTLL